MITKFRKLAAKLKHQLLHFTESIESMDSIKDPFQRQHIRLMNAITLFLIPIAVLGGIIHIIVDPSDTPLIHNSAFISILIAIMLLTMATLFGRYVNPRWTTPLVFVTGYACIMINASFDTPDYFDLNYLILLTVLATMLFKVKVVALVAIIEVASIIFVVIVTSPVAPANLIIFSIVGNLMLVFTSYYRNRLEDDRRQQLAESEAFLRLITDQLPVSVWITDEKLRRRATFGRIHGMDQLVTIPKNTAIKAYYQALGGKSAQFEDYRDNHHFQYHVEPMRNEANKIIGTLGVATDITAQKIAQEQSLQLELEQERVEMLSKFIEHSSHDLRTPLSNINTYLYLLDKTVHTDKEHGYVQVIREQSERLQRLIDNMLTLQRLELESNIEFTSVSLASLLDEITTSIRGRIEAEQILFEYTSPQNPPLLKINKHHMHTALTKIIENAIQFTPEGGTIRLLATCTEQSTTISIQDTGIGIPAEQIPRIFELFYRGDDSRPTSVGDNGLGLAIADRIIKAHKGSIRVDSALNEGAVFHITLPIASKQRFIYSAV